MRGRRWLLTVGLVGFGLVAVLCARGMQSKPITTDRGEVGALLRKWAAEGTAAGHAGDAYDNRDGGHSELNREPFPHLRKIEYTPEDLRARRNWAAQRVLLPGVVFGNSSTSAPPEQVGSNIRIYYGSPAGIAFLHEQYVRNNLYMYPEHRDHDPGHNGRGGYGDLYPTNTPYLIASQGSSGSDQPFMKAVAFTLAAFRPETKKKLVEKGLLMPTLQMILRRTSKQLAGPQEYRTGKAHPPVFEGSAVDPKAMVELAHSMTPDALPPLVQLRVLEETAQRPGRDFFDGPLQSTEMLAGTPEVIARIFRGKDYRRRLLVSAEKSIDANDRPLTFHWVLLRGDPEKVTIKPRGERGAEAEIEVAYPPRRPIAPGSALESNRVDIGVFANNGVYDSAPAFVTFFSLDSEDRTYDDAGRVQEIGYGMGEVVWKVADWPRFLGMLEKPDTPTGRLVRLSAEEREGLPAAAEAYRRAKASADAALKALRDAEAAFRAAGEGEPKKLAEKALAAARKTNEEAGRAVEAALDRPLAGKGPSVRAVVDRTLGELVTRATNDPTAAAALVKQADARGRKLLAETVRRLEGFGLPLVDGDPFRPKEPPQTAYQRMLRDRLCGELLSLLAFDGVARVSFLRNYVDARLTVPREWRDVYRHDAKGRLLGWTRFDGQKAMEFNAEGLEVLEKDAQGRCVRGRIVRYEQQPPGGPLRTVATDREVTYTYAGADDVTGRPTSR